MSRFQAPKQLGFTLLEILVVLLIIGVFSALVVPNIGGSRTYQEQKRELNRLAMLLEMAQEEALMQNLELGFDTDGKQYVFASFDEMGKAFIPLQEHPILKPYQLPEGLILQLEAEESAVALFVQPTVDEPQFTDPDTELSAEEPLIPRVWLLSSGEVTPFTLALYPEDQYELALHLSMDAMGNISLPELEEPEDDSK